MIPPLSTPGLDLTERVAIVTGAGGRIGRAISTMLTGAGARVMIHDLDGARSEGVAGLLSARGGTVMSMHGDIADPERAQDLVEMAVAVWQAPDIVINCAGVFPNTPVMELSDAAWHHVFGVNLHGPFYLARAAARAMVAAHDAGQQHPRHIINISSTAGESARRGAAHYCSSKAALNMLTKTLAIELAQWDIHVNAVAPGIIVDQVLQQPMPEGADPYVAALLDGVPLGRTGHGNDIANAVAFLISPAATWITGEILHVNGGSTAGRVALPRSTFAGHDVPAPQGDAVTDVAGPSHA